MNLPITGKWKGNYTYGQGYPAASMGHSETFIMDLQEINGVVKGFCNDDITGAIFDSPATISGTFSNNQFDFVKQYPCRFYIDDAGKSIIDTTMPSHEVCYTGQLKRSWLFRTPYFVGKWYIEEAYVQPDGDIQFLTSHGSWKMRKEKA